MKVNRVYRRCHVTGRGELNSGSETYNFEIHDVSASGASIELNYNLDPNQIYQLKITFIGNLIDITLHPTVKITRFDHVNTSYIYGITFLGLTKNEMVQIDEIVNHQCSVDNLTFGDLCEENSCMVNRRRRLHA